MTDLDVGWAATTTVGSDRPEPSDISALRPSLAGLGRRAASREAPYARVMARRVIWPCAFGAAGAEMAMTMTDDNIESAVRAELQDDPRLPYVDEIAVRAYGGAVTLRGTVGSFAQQRAAVADPRRTLGRFA